MRRQVNNVISVVHSAIRFGILKLFNWKNLSVCLIERFSPNIVFEMNRGAKVRLGKNCWIGANTVILRGTTIGDNCVIGAGCIVTGDIPSNSVYIQKRSTEINECGELHDDDKFRR